MNEENKIVFKNTFQFVGFLILIFITLFGGSYLVNKSAENKINYQDQKMSEAFFQKYGKIMDSMGLKYIKEIGPNRSDIEIIIDLSVLNLKNLKQNQQYIDSYCATPNTNMSYLLIDNENKVLRMSEEVVSKYGKEIVFQDFEACLESTIKQVNELKKRDQNLSEEFKLKEGGVK